MIVQWGDLRGIMMDHDLIGHGKPEQKLDLGAREPAGVINDINLKIEMKLVSSSNLDFWLKHAKTDQPQLKKNMHNQPKVCIFILTS
jgi:hypothetical protein